MLPWYWLWAPSFHWPFSGNVAQDIQPDTTWFFGSIPRDAGRGDIEKKIFETASYGRQLGVIMDVLIELADQATWPTAEAKERYDRLKKLSEKIARVKERHREDRAEAAAELLRRMQRDDPEGLRRLLSQFPLQLPDLK
jgi:hypothetical protein